MDRMLDMLKKAEENERNSTMAATNHSTLPQGPGVEALQIVTMGHDLQHAKEPGLYGLQSAFDKFEELQQAYLANNRKEKAEKKKHERLAKLTHKQHIQRTWQVLDAMGCVDTHNETAATIKECCAINRYFMEDGELRRQLTSDLWKLEDCIMYLAIAKDAKGPTPVNLAVALDTVCRFLKGRCALSPIDNLAVCYSHLPENEQQVQQVRVILAPLQLAGKQHTHRKGNNQHHKGPQSEHHKGPQSEHHKGPQSDEERRFNIIRAAMAEDTLRAIMKLQDSPGKHWDYNSLYIDDKDRLDAREKMFADLNYQRVEAGSLLF